MSDDPRCCGSGTCIIDADGICWCGQRWDGDRLIGPASACTTAAIAPAPAHPGDAPAEAARAAAHPTQP